MICNVMEDAKDLLYWLLWPGLLSPEQCQLQMLGQSISTQLDSVTRWIFFEGLNILISTFRVCADDFEGPAKVFPLTFYLLL
jgi:hypothetical protein